VNLLFGLLPEEMAWRGHVLDGLQARWNALTASLVLVQPGHMAVFVAAIWKPRKLSLLKAKI